MEIKFNILGKKHLGTLYKDNCIDVSGRIFVVDIDLREVNGMFARFSINGGKKCITDKVDIVDVEGGVIRVPFSTSVVKVGTHELEIIASMKNGGVKASQTYIYTIEKSLEAEDSVEAETNYPILIKLLQDVDFKIKEVDDSIDEIKDTINSRIEIASESLKNDIQEACNRLDSIDSQLEHVESVNVDSFGAIGDGVTDDTQAIKNCIDYVTNELKNTKKIVFSPGKTYMVDEIYPETGNTIDCTGAILKKIPTNKDFYAVISILKVKDVTVINPNIIGDRDTHLTNTGEGGHGIRIGGCSNIYIHNAFIKDCWGDGVYIGLPGDTLNENINLLGEIKIKRCRRQGVSVVYCTNSFIDTIIAEDINGTEPQCALDIEPNRDFEAVDNLHINHVIGIRCSNAINIIMNTPKMNISIDKITLEECERNIYIANNPEANKSGEENSTTTSTRSIKIGDIYTTKCIDKPIVQIKNHTIYYPQISINKVTCDRLEFKNSNTSEIERCLVLLEATKHSLINTLKYGKVNIGEINVNNLMSNVRTLNIRNGLPSGTEIDVENVYISKIQVNDNSKLQRPLTQASSHKNYYVDYPIKDFLMGENTDCLQNGCNIILDSIYPNSNIDIRSNLRGCILYTNKQAFNLTFKEGMGRSNIYLDGIKQENIGYVAISKAQNKIYHISIKPNGDVYISTMLNSSLVENKVVSTNSRPTGIPQGAQVFDAQINKPIWYKGGGQWVDATGAVV